MGIYDRDYMRRDRLPSLPLGKLLLILAGAVGVLMIALTHCPANWREVLTGVRFGY